MDKWKFYDITHKRHVLCNPMSLGKLDRLIRLIELPPEAKVIEIAMGKGEFILRLAESYGVSGIGIDISPHCIADAEGKRSARTPGARLTFKEMDGAKFTPEAAESYDLAACIGASWIYGGHKQTLEALSRMAAPDGWVVVGEPFWLQEAPAPYLEAIGVNADAFGTHADNVATAEGLGLQLVHALAGNTDDWDQYEGLKWHAVDAYARSHSDDPDLPEVVRRVAEEKTAYLNWGRDTLGWAIYLFRRPAR